MANDIVIGMGFISFIFAYLSFKLRENENAFNQIASLFFFSLSLVFVNFLIYTMTLIVQNEAAYSYLNNGIINVALLVVTWTTIIVAILYFITLLITGISIAFKSVNNKMKSKSGGFFG